MYAQVNKSKTDALPSKKGFGKPILKTLPARINRPLMGKINANQNTNQMIQKMADNSPQVKAQDKLKQIIQGSDNTEQSIQRKALGVLGGYTVDDTKYANGNWATIKTHVAGEWDKSNTSKPTGGHILNAMTAKWGQAYANKENKRNATTNASGVYFTGAIPNARKIVGDTFDYFLVDYSDTSNKKQSKTKTSSFWPTSWDTSNLGNVLADSYKTNTNDTYASKAEVSYWFTWDSLGDDTAYPLARYKEMT